MNDQMDAWKKKPIFWFPHSSLEDTLCVNVFDLKNVIFWSALWVNFEIWNSENEQTKVVKSDFFLNPSVAILK